MVGNDDDTIHYVPTKYEPFVFSGKSTPQIGIINTKRGNPNR